MSHYGKADQTKTKSDFEYKEASKDSITMMQSRIITFRKTYNNLDFEPFKLERDGMNNIIKN